MTPNTTISISLIFSLVSMIGVLVSIIATFKGASEKEQSKRLSIEENFIKINTKLDYLTQTINNVVSQSQKNSDEIKIIREEMVRYNERIETLFRYKNDHEERLKNIEDEKP